MNNLNHLFLTMLSELYTQQNISETPHIPYLRQPALSPDGSEIAFCYAGDIWIVEVAGGKARRITSHPSYDSRPIFSPDGTQLAFASERTHNGNSPPWTPMGQTG